MINNNKIFCIGYPRTGTQSLTDAFKLMNFKSLHLDFDLVKEINKKGNNFNFTNYYNFDVFSDIPFPLIYKEINRRSPKAKFILSIRNHKNWIKSIEILFTCLKQFIKKNNHRYPWLKEFGIFHKKMYGSSEFEKNIFLKSYDEHNKKVMKYFENKKDKLLIINLEKDNNWQKICSFLDTKIPNMPFPYRNKKTDIYKTVGYN